MIDSLVHLLYRTPWPISVLVTTTVTLLLLAPVLVIWFIMRRVRNDFCFTVVGVTFGLVGAPLSIWFYLHFFTDLLRGLLLGFPSLLLLTIYFRNPGLVSHEIVVNPYTGTHTALHTLEPLRIALAAAGFAAVGGAVDIWLKRQYAKRTKAPNRPLQPTGQSSAGG
jgi:hypothetical protein